MVTRVTKLPAGRQGITTGTKVITKRSPFEMNCERNLWIAFLFQQLTLSF